MNKQVTNESGFNKNLKAVNMEVPFYGWVPLTAVKTEADKQKYNNKGYQISHTANEFKANYPFVDTSKVFYSDELMSHYYFDEDSLVLFMLPFYNKTYVSQTNEPFKNWFARTISHDFTAVQEYTLEYYKFRLSPRFPMPSFISESVKSEYLCKVIAKIGFFEGAPKLIRKLFDDCDYTRALSHYAEHILNGNIPTDNKQEYESLPNVMTVYAGMSDSNVCYGWTSNKYSAYLLAHTKAHGANIRMMQGFANKSDIKCNGTGIGEENRLMSRFNVYDVTEITL
ncbi:MAG: hypothetical protein RR313_05685 [Anaerovoracaceae bacterium]